MKKKNSMSPDKLIPLKFKDPMIYAEFSKER